MRDLTAPALIDDLTLVVRRRPPRSCGSQAVALAAREKPTQRGHGGG
jgi:hypothetical protein